MDVPQQAPFPILPAAIQICSVLGSLYPHLDIIDDKVVVQTGRSQLEQSLHALALGACFLLLGFYACQFLPALGPLRKEYLGTLALTQAGHGALLLVRAALFPDSFGGEPLGTALGLTAAACVAVLVRADSKAEPPPGSPAPEPRAAARARATVGVVTHAAWLVFAITFALPYLSPLLSPHVAPTPHRPYGTAALVLTLVVALARLGVSVQERMYARRLKRKAE